MNTLYNHVRVNIGMIENTEGKKYKLIHKIGHTDIFFYAAKFFFGNYKANFDVSL